MSGKVLLVDDEVVARDLLARGLAREGFTVEVAGDGEQALQRLTDDVDFVVTDLLMPRLDGVALLERLSERGHRALRVAITSFADKQRVVSVLNAGADYLLEKPFTVDQLARLLERLARERDGDAHALGRFFHARLLGLPLTPRERELVECVLRGESNKQIAHRLGISEQTVKNTLSRAYSNLGVQSRGELFHRVFPV